jgi:hypothetical protein
MSKISYKPSPRLADIYFELKAQQAELAEKEKALKEAMLKLGTPVVEGRFARVTISEIAEAWVFDGAKAKAFLSPAIIAKCQSLRAGSLRFVAKARVADASVEKEAA